MARRRIFPLVLLFAAALPAQQRRIALTIDDLPISQSGPEACQPERLFLLTKQILGRFAAEKAPLTAFVVTSQCPNLTDQQRKAALDLWRDAGVELGNHTHSHKSLNVTPIEQYEQDVLKAARLLNEWTGEPVHWFRWPMLHAGATPDVRERLEKFLADHNFREAPVTFDNAEWIFAFLYAHARRTGDTALEQRIRDAYVPYMEQTLAFFENQSMQLFGREIPQILLMHSNLLNAELGGDLLRMLRARGYEFISLEQALADPAYSEPNTYVAKNGVSWLHRWRATRGLDIQLEPDPPKWVAETFEEINKAR